jgi:queuine tRNA-ribosyltransferase
MSFTVTAKDPRSRARCGVLKTAHGDVETPVFMPVATQASVKALCSEDLASLGVRAILSNSYHLYLRPGAEVVEAAGGLHSFMRFPGMILTDSGGFQVYSLADLRDVSDESVTFQSHIDGSKHTLTPESVQVLQHRLGSDIRTPLDVCAPYPCDRAQALTALSRTHAWLDASCAKFKELDDGSQFFPIVQGSFEPDLRERAAERVLGLDPQGICLGGFSVGEPKDLTWRTLERTVERLPEGKPRYLMGMGAPEDLWNAVSLGVDMLDCVWPTRVARNGQVMACSGRFNIRNAEFRKDFSPLDPECSCPVCRTYTRAYLSHLFRSRELSSYRLLTLHNVHFNLRIMRRIRDSIRDGTFVQERKAFLMKI